MLKRTTNKCGRNIAGGASDVRTDDRQATANFKRFGNHWYEVEVELSIQLKNENEVEYE